MASIGDPSDPATWSGTPLNISKSLMAYGYHVVPVTVDQTLTQKSMALCHYEMRRVREAPSCLTKLPSHLKLDERSDYRWGATSHHQLASSLAKSTSRLNVKTIIHAGSPATIPDGSQLTHHLICDTTWFGYTRYFDSPSRFPPKLRDDIDSLYRSAYQRVQHFFPLSRSLAAELQERYGISSDRITPIGSGRGSIRANDDSSKDYSAKRVLFAAKLRFVEKGGTLLVDAMRLVADIDPDVKLTIVGGPKDFDTRDLPPNVEVLGYLTPAGAGSPISQRVALRNAGRVRTMGPCIPRSSGKSNADPRPSSQRLS